jgi:[acyl-carrier-protein] S-malonyltransferase
MMGLENHALEAICMEAAQGEVVSPANFNSPGQIVIAGHTTAVDRAIELAKAAGAKRALPLPVSAPFHCSLMKSAGVRLAEILAEIHFAPMQVPVVTNVEALPNADSARVMGLLVEQVCAPVRWAESVAKMSELGVDRFVEIGPGKVLSGLIKRIAKGATIQNIEDVASLKKL